MISIYDMTDKKYDLRKYRKNLEGTPSSPKSPHRETGMSIHDELFGKEGVVKAITYFSTGHTIKKNHLFNRNNYSAR